MSRSRRRRWRRRLIAVLVAAASLVPVTPVPAGGTARAVATTTPVALRFAPPVDAGVRDGWRPPASPYGPGNRGWEYATTVGEVVRSVGAGTVSFAGPVGGAVSVTVRHIGGLRTTYSYLSDATVRAGVVVALGDQVGVAGDTFHLGVLLDEEYIDPALLFEPGALRLGARLVPLTGTALGSATLTRRSVYEQADEAGHRDPFDHHPAPGPPTVAARRRRARDVQPMGRRRQWPLSA
jgi:murein DD-endopeptidase MepM/ murein hydrolase activator NlpD